MDAAAARAHLIVAVERLDRIRRKHHLIPGVLRTELAVLSGDLDYLATALAEPDVYEQAGEAEHAERGKGKRRASQSQA